MTSSDDDFQKEIKTAFAANVQWMKTMQDAFTHQRERISELELDCDALRRLLLETGMVDAQALARIRAQLSAEHDQLDTELRESIEREERDDGE